MILYNVTTNVDKSIEADWLQWMKDVHIPNVMKSKMFFDYKFFRVLSLAEDETGATYAVQFFCDSMENYQLYQDRFAPALREEVSARYGNQYASFRTLLESV
jgi:Domain of unknown function (DUF4286)